MKSFREILIIISIITFYTSGFAQVLSKLDSLILDSKSNNDSIAVMAMNKLNYNYWGTSIDSSIVWGKRAVHRSEKSGVSVFLAQSHYNLAAAYDKAGDFENALNYYLKALDFSQDNRMGKIRILNGIGILCRSMGEPEKSIKYYLNALALLKKDENDFAEAMINNNLANAYSEVDSVQKAETYHKNALATRQKIMDTLGMAQSLNNIGNIYLLRKDYKVALEKLTAAEKLINEEDGSDEFVNLLQNIGNTYSGLKKYDLAKEYLDKAIYYGKKIGLREELADVYHSMAVLNYESGSFSTAYENLNQFTELKDSILNLAKTKELNRLETKYRVKENERKLMSAQKENELRSIKQSQQSRTIWIITIGLFLISLLSIYLGHIYIQKQKINKILTSQKREIQEKNSEINKTLTEKELLIQEINHRAKNNLYTVERLLTAQLKEAQQNETKVLLKETQKRIQSISLLHNQLFSNNMSASVNMKLYINEIVDAYFKTEGKIPILLDIDDIIVDSDKAMVIGLILNELITNSLKHSYKNMDSLSISFKNKMEILKLEVKDGVKEFNKNKVSEIKVGNSSFFGLELVKGLTHQLNGSVNFNDELGFTVSVTIPV